MHDCICRCVCTSVGVTLRGCMFDLIAVQDLSPVCMRVYLLAGRVPSACLQVTPTLFAQSQQYNHLVDLLKLPHNASALVRASLIFTSMGDK